MKIFGRIVLLMLCAVLAVTATLGCNRNENYEPDLVEDDFDEEETYLIEFMGWGSPEEKSNYETLISEFNKVYPNIIVMYTHVDSESFMTTLNNRAENLPDVFFMPDEEFYSWAHGGRLLNFDAMLTDEEKNDFYDEAIDRYYFNRDTVRIGKSSGAGLYGLPKDLGPYTLVYNKTLLASQATKYGATATDLAVINPDVPMTWEQFRTLLKKVAPDGATNGVYGIGAYPLDTAVYSNNADYFTEGAVTQKIDTVQFKDALQFAAGLHTVDLVMPSPDSQADVNGFQRFSGQTALFSFMGPWDQTGYWKGNGLGFEWDILPVPYGPGADRAYGTSDDGKSTAWIGSMAYSISANSPSKSASLRFAKFLSMSEEGQRKFYELGQQIPNLKSMAEEYINDSESVIGTKYPASRHVFLDIADSFNRNPLVGGKARSTYFTYATDWKSNFDDQLVNVWKGTETVDAFVSRYKATFQSSLDLMRSERDG